MNKEIEEMIEKLSEKRVQLMQTLCEDNSIHHPNVILQAVNELRSLTRTINLLKGEKDRFK